MEYTCCFTGHRPSSIYFLNNQNNPKYCELSQLLQFHITRLITEQGVTRFITGMAMGIDIIAAEIVLELKKAHPHITLECAIPCVGQTAKWNEKWQKRYGHILENADKSVVLSEAYTKAVMHIRNRYMVDNSRYVIAVWNGSGGGTASTLKYAEKKERKITVINPNDI